MKISNSRSYLLILAMIAFASASMAQEGRITGKVLDLRSGEPLVGATVVHVLSGQKVMTDFDGEFMLPVSSVGNNTIEVSYISYEKKALRHIEVKPGDQVTLNIHLTKVKKSATRKEPVRVQPHPEHLT